MINDIEKIFFAPGDLVVLKHKELKSPVMLVQEKGEICNVFKGFKCRWFDKNDVLQEAIFSTKDLQFYNKK